MLRNLHLNIKHVGLWVIKFLSHRNYELAITKWKKRFIFFCTQLVVPILTALSSIWAVVDGLYPFPPSIWGNLHVWIKSSVFLLMIGGHLHLLMGQLSIDRAQLVLRNWPGPTSAVSQHQPCNRLHQCDDEWCGCIGICSPTHSEHFRWNHQTQRLQHENRGNTHECPFVSRPCQMVPSALFFHLSQTIEGGATYPSRTPWPPATSGCRKSWLWWSHSGRSSWWRGRWRSVSSPCHLPHLPSSTVLCSALQLEVHSASGIPPDGGWHSARRNPA